MDVLNRYARSLKDVGSKLMLVSTNQRIDEQLAGPASGYSAGSSGRSASVT